MNVSSVLFVSNYYSYAGAETVMRNQISQAVAAGVRCDAFLAFTPRMAISGVSQVYNLNLMDKKYIFNIRSLFRLITVCAKNRYDVIHVHNINGGVSFSIYIVLYLVHAFHGTRVFHSIHDYGLICLNGFYFDFNREKQCTDCKLKRLSLLRIGRRKCSKLSFFASLGKRLNQHFATFCVNRKFVITTVPHDFNTEMLPVVQDFSILDNI